MPEVYKYSNFAGINTKKTKPKASKFPKAFPKKMSRMMPLPRAKTWDPKNQACNAVYAICMSEARKGTAATAESIIRNIKYSPALEMTTLKMVMRAMSKAIMDIYDDAGEIGATKGETENQCFNRVYIELTAMEEAKEYFEKMAKF
jgi:hypothetical protein